MKVETELPVGKVDPGIRALRDGLDHRTIGAQAAVVEELGYDGIVLRETKGDPFIGLALAGQATRRLSLTTAVAIAFPRSPTVTAMTAWTLAQATDGRFVLGLGTQVKGHIERRYGLSWSAPAPWLADYVGAVRAVWDAWQHGTPLDFHSDHYTLTLMNPLFDPGPIEHPDIPIQISGLNAGMARLAGQTADGLRPHPILTRRFLAEVVMPAIAQGAARAGRDPDAIAVCASPLIATGPDEASVAKQMTDVRARISFYASTRTYRALFDLHGWGDVADRLSVLSQAGRWDEMEHHVTDEMVEEIAVVGTWDEIAEKVWRRYEGICTAVEFGIPVTNQQDQERLAAMVRDIQRGFPGGGLEAIALSDT